MALSADMTRYLLWAAVVGSGCVFALADWRWIKRPLLGLLLVASMFGGFFLTKLSPFDFVTGGYYMEGVLISAGSALALAGYVVAMGLQFACRLAGRRGSRGP